MSLQDRFEERQYLSHRQSRPGTHAYAHGHGSRRRDHGQKSKILLRGASGRARHRFAYRDRRYRPSPSLIKKYFGLAHNEARIVLKIIDQNDNAPRFVNESMPVIAAVSSYTAYGTPVATVQVSVLVRAADSRRSRFSMYVSFLSVGRRSGLRRQLRHQIRNGRRSRGKTVLQRGRVHRPYTHGRRVQPIDEQHGLRFRYTGDGQSRRDRRSISHHKRFR